MLSFEYLIVQEFHPSFVVLAKKALSCSKEQRFISLNFSNKIATVQR